MDSKSFVLIPGSGGMAWYWHRVVPLLQSAGQEAVAVDLPGDDDHVGLNGYAELVVQATEGRRNLVLVAASLGRFIAPLVCERTPVQTLIFVNAMIPLPGETAGAWWDNTGAVEARIGAAQAGGYDTDFDLKTYFLHDVPESVLQTAPPQREQSEALFKERCHFRRWPKVRIRTISSDSDRFFPLTFQRRVARDRLDTEIEVVPGGHLVALSHPIELVERLLQAQ
jgi:pimeloyl-ACP methyl ester carboxylesterase